MGLVSRDCSLTLCETIQEQIKTSWKNKNENESKKKKKQAKTKKKKALDKELHTGSTRILLLYENSPVPVMAWVRFSDPHNIKVT